jgi:hypothetical protein
MSQRFPTSALLLLLSVVACTIGCNRSDVAVTTPAPSMALSSSFEAEPGAVRPEFFPHDSCFGRPSFGFGFTIVIGGDHDLLLFGLRVGFHDRFGGSFFPQVMPTPTMGASTLPSSGPIPLPGIAAIPGASPIPFAGREPVHGLLVPGGKPGRLPYFVKFGCGINPFGTLRINADLKDTNGQSRTLEAQIRVE